MMKKSTFAVLLMAAITLGCELPARQDSRAKVAPLTRGAAAIVDEEYVMVTTAVYRPGEA